MNRAAEITSSGQVVFMMLLIYLTLCMAQRLRYLVCGGH